MGKFQYVDYVTDFSSYTLLYVASVFDYAIQLFHFSLKELNKVFFQFRIFNLFHRNSCCGLVFMIQSVVDKFCLFALLTPYYPTLILGIVYYLPNHGVIVPNKPVRVVFYTSARYKGVCLNDHLYRGIDYLNSLTSVLTSFRRHYYAISMDIEKMFHMVNVRERAINQHFVTYGNCPKNQNRLKYGK